MDFPPLMSFVGLALLLFGALACFAVYRLFMVALGITSILFWGIPWYGFRATSGFMFPTTLILTILFGGLGVFVSLTFYFFGVFAVGTFPGILIGTFVFPPPNWAVALLLGIIGGLLAIWLQKPFIITSTAFTSVVGMVAGVCLMLSSLDGQPKPALSFFVTLFVSLCGIFKQYGLFAYSAGKSQQPAPNQRPEHGQQVGTTGVRDNLGEDSPDLFHTPCNIIHGTGFFNRSRYYEQVRPSNHAIHSLVFVRLCTGAGMAKGSV